MPRGSNALRNARGGAATAGACGWNTGVAARAAAGALSSVACPLVSAPRTRARRRSSNAGEDQPAAPIERDNDRRRAARARAARLPAAPRCARRRGSPRAPTALADARASSSRDASPSSDVVRRRNAARRRARACALRRTPRTLRAAAGCRARDRHAAADTSCGERSAAPSSARHSPVEPAATTSVRSSSGAGATRSVTSVSTAERAPRARQQLRQVVARDVLDDLAAGLERLAAAGDGVESPRSDRAQRRPSRAASRRGSRRARRRSSAANGVDGPQQRAEIRRLEREPLRVRRERALDRRERRRGAAPSARAPPARSSRCRRARQGRAASRVDGLADLPLRAAADGLERPRGAGDDRRDVRCVARDEPRAFDVSALMRSESRQVREALRARVHVLAPLLGAAAQRRDRPCRD